MASPDGVAAPPRTWRSGDDLPSYRDVVKLRGTSLLPEGADDATPLRVVLAGNCNTDFMTDAVRLELEAAGRACDVVSSEYGAGVQEALAGELEGDVWVFWLSAMGATDGGTRRGELDVAGIAAAATHLINKGRRVIVVPPEPLPVEEDPYSPFGDWRREQTAALAEALPEHAILLSAEGAVRRLGSDRWMGARYWENAKAPCHPDGVVAVGVDVGVTIERLLAPRVKAVVTDLDDTLWGGLVGEVGPEALDLDPQGTGRSYLELQRFLADLRERGILLGVVSKNDEEVARRPFAERSEMVLTLDDVSFFSASWETKHQAIEEFARQMNIGIDSVCFLDDSPTEREEARVLLPGLIVPELPASPDARVPYLVRTKLFTTPSVSEEDRLRARSLESRAALADTTIDHATYLAGLEMTLEAAPLGPANMPRAVSLINKTNQFNLNGVRLPPGDVEAVASDKDAYAYAYRLTDRIGDHGVIAVLLARRDGDVAEIVSWVLSCRVFTRGVEWAIAEHFAGWADAAGITTIRGEYVRTDRNHLVAGVLPEIGLGTSEGDDDRRSFEGPGITPPDHHVRIETA